LVSETASARAQADLEAARLAETYRAHPLLRYFAVPRFRLPSVKLSVPVAVVDLPARESHQPSVSQARDAVATAFRHELMRRGIALTDAEWSTVTTRLKEAAKQLAAGPRAHESELELADALSGAAAEALPERLGEAQPERPLRPSTGSVLAGLRDSARLAVIGARLPASQVEVKATAGELAGVDPGTVIRVELTLNEQGLEWSGGEDEPGRLTPE
jgi:hypothetical protein